VAGRPGRRSGIDHSDGDAAEAWPDGRDAGAESTILMDANGVVSGAAWREFCNRLAMVGDRILADDFPSAPADRAEGVRHLATQVACWLTYAAGYADPERPAFFRSSDPVFLWGGPNVDQVARRARIAGDGIYRVSGRMGACEEFVLQVKLGATQSGGADVGMEIYASQLGVGPGDDFEILLSAEPQPGNWFALDPAASFVHVRDYYFDWQPCEPATFVIERLDTQGVPAPRPSPERVAAMLDDAAREVEHSLVFWCDYQARMRAAAQEVNRFGEPAFIGRAVRDIQYSHAFVAVGRGEALVVELDPADATLWDVMLYNRTWYEALDSATRLTSLNHRQVAVDGDGRVRIVIGGFDPRVANWLDTQGRAEVLATIRWFRPPATPTVRATLVPRERLADRLPIDTTCVDAETRRDQIRARAAHTAWRYRS
jgi:Protein of unknown function (DUF1214)